MKFRRSYKTMQGATGEHIIWTDKHGDTLSPYETLARIKKENEQKGYSTKWGDEGKLIVTIPPNYEHHYIPMARGVQEIYYELIENDCDECSYCGMDVPIYKNGVMELALCNECLEKSDIIVEE